MLSINQQFINAAENNRLDELKNLLNQGADIHADDDDYALKWSARNGHLKIVKFLITQGGNIHADNDNALRLAAFHGHLEVVKFLIAQGANIHADNNSALRWSATNGHLEIVKLLIENSANIHVDGDYTLKWSAKNGHHGVWQVLSDFIQEEKLLVAASDAMIITAQGLLSVDESLVPALGSVALVASDSMLQTKPQTITKVKRSKI